MSIVSFIVRRAEPRDALGIVTVITRSIRHLCAPYYDNNLTLLDRWCHNKTEPNILEWLSEPRNIMLIAEHSCRPECIGVGLVRHLAEPESTGEVQLCYVDPAYVKRGVGSALLRAMEAEIFRLTDSIILRATLNAESFYTKLGYATLGPPSGEPLAIAMKKVRY